MIVTCPRCKGRGGDPVYSDYPMGCQSCHACNGSGKINDQGLNYKVEVVNAGFAPLFAIAEHFDACDCEGGSPPCTECGAGC